MLELLAEAEAELPRLLLDVTGWSSLRIDYHPPFVDRLYRPWRGLRLNLHRIWPCTKAEALFHPHPWPSAMKLVSGTYEMDVGFGAGTSAPPVMATIRMEAGSRYAMTHPDAWHDVRPGSAPSLSIMVTGAPWGRPSPLPPGRSLEPLGDTTVAELIALFLAHYGR